MLSLTDSGSMHGKSRRGNSAARCHLLLTKEMKVEAVISCVDEIQVDQESQSSADRDIESSAILITVEISFQPHKGMFLYFSPCGDLVPLSNCSLKKCLLGSTNSHVWGCSHEVVCERSGLAP